MQAHVTGQAGVSAPAPTLHVGPYRRALLAVIIGNPLFTDAEQLRANHAAHECYDAARLALWTRNSLRVAKEREAAAQPTGNLLADLQNPAYVAQHSAEQAAPGFKTLTVADAYKAAESLRQAFAAAQQQPAAPPAPVAEPYATPAQCDEVYRLASYLSAREKADALRRLPQLTEPEAAAFILGLRLRRGPRLRFPVTLAGQLVQVPVAERHYEGSKVDYVQEIGEGPVRPRREVLFPGPLVRRVWAN